MTNEINTLYELAFNGDLTLKEMELYDLMQLNKGDLNK